MQQTKEISCDNLSACREQIYNEILAEMKALASGIQQAVSNAASPPKSDIKEILCNIEMGALCKNGNG